LHQTNSYDLALSSVRIFLEGYDFNDGNDIIVQASSTTKDSNDTEDCANSNNLITLQSENTTKSKFCILFKKLENKFSSNPEYNSIRLVHLQFAYSLSYLYSSVHFSISKKSDESGSKPFLSISDQK
jgi:hypothetical protein